jgi:hypothetical protein
MPGLGETEIEMAERHIREGEEHVAHQLDILARLPPSGELTEIARKSLADSEENLAAHRARLAHLLDRSSA